MLDQTIANKKLNSKTGCILGIAGEQYFIRWSFDELRWATTGDSDGWYHTTAKRYINGLSAKKPKHYEYRDGA